MWLPAEVEKEVQRSKHVEERAERRQMLEHLLDFDDPVCKQWNKHLHELDPRLRMGRGKPIVKTGWGVIPGYYHWFRDNETAAPTVTPITTPEQGYREPDSGVLEDLKRSDLQNPAVFARLLKQRAAAEKAEKKAKQEAREARQQEIYERWQSGNRTQISTSDTPWTQSARARHDVR